MSVWDSLVGQPAAVEALQAAGVAARAVLEGAPAGPATAAMSPSWLLTGPAGSGRSVAGTALAAALSCTDPGPPGCGHCPGCHQVLAGTSPDVLVMRPEGLSIAVADVRTLVVQAALAPTSGRWRVVLVEDADRLVKGVDERAAAALLKSIEEPAARTVFVLCAPSAVDVPATIRSRCRLVGLVTPSAAAVAGVLVGEGVDPVLADFAARAAQGHVGRARRLARDEDARGRRLHVLRLPTRLSSPASALAAAAEVVAAATEEAAAVTTERAEVERAELERSWGLDGGADGPPGRRAPRGKGRADRAAGAALRDLERVQRSRGTRASRDALDRALVDLLGLYRDVLAIQLGGAGGAGERLVHPDQAELSARLARATRGEQSLRCLDAILEARTRIAANSAPLLAVEAMALTLARP